MSPSRLRRVKIAARQRDVRFKRRDPMGWWMKQFSATILKAFYERQPFPLASRFKCLKSRSGTPFVWHNTPSPTGRRHEERTDAVKHALIGLRYSREIAW